MCGITISKSVFRYQEERPLINIEVKKMRCFNEVLKRLVRPVLFPNWIFKMHVRVKEGKRKRIPEGFAAAENGKWQYKPDGNHQHKPQQGTEQKCNGCNFFPEKNGRCKQCKHINEYDQKTDFFLGEKMIPQCL